MVLLSYAKYAKSFPNTSSENGLHKLLAVTISFPRLLLASLAPTFLGLILETNLEQNYALVRHITGIMGKMGNTTFVSVCKTSLIRVNCPLPGMTFHLPCWYYLSSLESWRQQKEKVNSAHTAKLTFSSVHSLKWVTNEIMDQPWIMIIAQRGVDVSMISHDI